MALFGWGIGVGVDACTVGVPALAVAVFHISCVNSYDALLFIFSEEPSYQLYQYLQLSITITASTSHLFHSPSWEGNAIFTAPLMDLGSWEKQIIAGISQGMFEILTRSRSFNLFQLVPSFDLLLQRPIQCYSQIKNTSVERSASQMMRIGGEEEEEGGQAGTVRRPRSAWAASPYHQSVIFCCLLVLHVLEN